MVAGRRPLETIKTDFAKNGAASLSGQWAAPSYWDSSETLLKNGLR
jgi:hypothetical protein